jgi:hypothetical protein
MLLLKHRHRPPMERGGNWPAACLNQSMSAARVLTPCDRILPAFLHALGVSAEASDRLRSFVDLLGRADRPPSVSFVASVPGEHSSRDLHRTPWGAAAGRGRPVRQRGSRRLRAGAVYRTARVTAQGADTGRGSGAHATASFRLEPAGAGSKVRPQEQSELDDQYHDQEWRPDELGERGLPSNEHSASKSVEAIWNALRPWILVHEAPSQDCGRGHNNETGEDPCRAKPPDTHPTGSIRVSEEERRPIGERRSGIDRRTDRRLDDEYRFTSSCNRNGGAGSLLSGITSVKSAAVSALPCCAIRIAANSPMKVFPELVGATARSDAPSRTLASFIAVSWSLLRPPGKLAFH